VIAEHSYCEKRIELWLENPGERISVPRELEGAGIPQERIALSGRTVHAALAAQAQPVEELTTVALEMVSMRSAIVPVVLTELRLAATYKGLPIAGVPDDVIIQDSAVKAVLELKTTLRQVMPESDRGQLLVYGYLLEESSLIKNVLDVSHMLLVCGYGLGHDPRDLGKLTPDDIAGMLLAIAAQVRARPASTTWRTSCWLAGRKLRLHVFPYQRAEAEAVLDHAAEYWLGKRRATPPDNPAKCRLCQYNRLGKCPDALAPFGG